MFWKFGVKEANPLIVTEEKVKVLCVFIIKKYKMHNTSVWWLLYEATTLSKHSFWDKLHMRITNQFSNTLLQKSVLGLDILRIE